jgi:ketopantoate reductase
VGPTTAVIPLQNGIDASERLIPILGKDAVMGGVAQISATVAEPGVIRQTGTFMRLVFGELDGRPSQRGAAFHALCRGAGFDSTNTSEIIVALWEKFVLLATNSSVSTLTRLPASCGTIPTCLPCSKRPPPRWRRWVAPAASACQRISRPGRCKPFAIFRRK